MRRQMITSVMAIVLCGFATTRADIPASQPAGELRPILSADQKRAAARQLVERFVAHVNASSTLPPAAKAAVADGWKKHSSDEDPESFLQAGLAIISEPYKKGLTALDAEKHEEAAIALQPLTKDADPYL